MTGKKSGSGRRGPRNLLYQEPSWWGFVALGLIVFALVVALTVLFFRGSDPVASSSGERMSGALRWPVLGHTDRVPTNEQTHA